jgi:ribosome-binding factor A
MQVKRSDRVAAAIQQAAAHYVLTEVQDPLLKRMTITGVRLSNDLRFAKIYYSVLGEQDIKAQVDHAIEQHIKSIRKHIGQRLNLRYVPEIRFYFDDSSEYASHIEDLIKKIHQ